MPTVDELPVATAVSDSDELLVSQAGVGHKATRAQLLAGLQPQLALASGRLLGRQSPGAGAPESIAVGANLTLSGGVLSAGGLNVASLTSGSAPAAADMVPLGQGGQNVAVPYAQFMAGLAGLAGVDASTLTATATGATRQRSLADLLADAAPVEDFGAVGDGVTDDGAAFVAAVASGRPVRLGPKTYVVNGQWTIMAPGVTLIGVPGRSVLKRASQTGNGAWIAVQADQFRAEGVTFDANRAAVSQESWGVLVTSQCTTSGFHRCAFLNAAGATLGSGLVIQASDPAICEHVVQDCEFAGNTAHGLWVQACTGVQIVGCRAHGNGSYGLCIDYNDATFRQKARLIQVLGNRAWGNTRGIAVGNFNATNTQPPIWGTDNPDVISVVVAGNLCHDNEVYGIAVSGNVLLVEGNVLSGNGTVANNGAGILANVSTSRIAGNMVTGSAAFGIDAGGSVGSDVLGNFVVGPVNGINAGGSVDLRVGNNVLQGCTAAGVSVENVETDGNGVAFPLATRRLEISGNRIALPVTGALGVVLRDGPQDILVTGNCFSGDGVDASQCLQAATDSVTVEGNRFNMVARFTCNPSMVSGVQTVIFPDIAEAIGITGAPAPVQSMMSSFAAQVAGSIAFVRVTNGGSGYTNADVVIGGNGTGAAARAVISGGAVIGIVVTSRGGGYGPVGTMVPVTITGDGTGATATAWSGLPVPEERRLRTRCDVPVVFARAGSPPLLDNYTGADLSVPAGAEITWRGAGGAWRASLSGTT
jgi:hypothetical protein